MRSRHRGQIDPGPRPDVVDGQPRQRTAGGPGRGRGRVGRRGDGGAGSGRRRRGRGRGRETGLGRASASGDSRGSSTAGGDSHGRCEEPGHRPQASPAGARSYPHGIGWCSLAPSRQERRGRIDQHGPNPRHAMSRRDQRSSEYVLTGAPADSHTRDTAPHGRAFTLNADFPLRLVDRAPSADSAGHPHAPPPRPGCPPACAGWWCRPCPASG